MHPSQAQPARAAVSRASRKPAPSYQHAGRFRPYPRRRGGPQRKIMFNADPARLSGILPPAVRDRRAARRPARMGVDARVASYADQARRAGRNPATLTGSQRRRIAAKGRLTAADRVLL